MLGTDAPAGQALETPLMVGLARVIYNLRPGEPTGELREPKELCDPSPADRKAVESLLFDAFIPAAYRRDPSGRWTAQKAENWLVFLARHLEQKIGGPDLAWWQLPLATRAYPLADGILTGVSTAIFGGVVVGGALVVVGVTAVVAFVIGAVFGAVAGS